MTVLRDRIGAISRLDGERPARHRELSNFSRHLFVTLSNNASAVARCEGGRAGAKGAGREV
jgi:hypothetical protein